MKVMTMQYLFVSFFASELLLVTPCAMTKKEKVQNTEEATQLLEVFKTISEFPIRKTEKAPWKNADFTPGKGQHEVDTCRKVSMYVSFNDLGLSEIISPMGFSAFRCKGKCSSTQRKKFPNRSSLMALLERKKGIKVDDEACCVPTKLGPIKSVLLFDKNNNIVLKQFDDMVVEECGCK